MANKIGLTLVTAGCLLAAIVLFVAGASSAAQARTGTSTEFSAQQQQENKGQQKKAAPAARPAPQRAAPQRAAPHQRLRKGRLHVRLPRAVRNSVWSLLRRRLRAWLHRAGRHQARLLGKSRSAHGQTAEVYAESGSSDRRRSQSNIAHCRSAGRYTARDPSRHRITLARGAGARRRPRCHPGPKLLGVAQWVPRTSWQRLADVCRAQRLGRNRNRLESILPLRLHFGARALLRRAD